MSTPINITLNLKSRELQDISLRDISLREQTYDTIDPVLYFLVEIIYPQPDSREKYLADPKPHPIMEYLAEYSELMSDLQGARIVANKMGMSIPEDIIDDDLYFVEVLEEYLHTSSANPQVDVSLADIITMTREQYFKLIRNVKDDHFRPYYDRIYYVMETYYRLVIK